MSLELTPFKCEKGIQDNHSTQRLSSWHEQSPRKDQVLEGLDDNLNFIIVTTIKITHLGFSCLTTTSQSFD